MDSLVIEGTIVQKLDPQEGVSARGQWKKQDFIIETNDQYPKKVCVCCWNDKIDDLAQYNIHDSIRVGINIESREYNKRWYTDIKAWKIEPLTQKTGTGSSSNASEGSTANSGSDDVLGISFSDEDEELPF
ncbi:DUF3127 domain-containing protein [bacterium]|nr:DUF3127 domain-containing protein [bacterium]